MIDSGRVICVRKLGHHRFRYMIGAKPLSKSMMVAYLLTKFSEIVIKIHTFSSNKMYWKYRLLNSGHFDRPQYANPVHVPMMLPWIIWINGWYWPLRTIIRRNKTSHEQRSPYCMGHIVHCLNCGLSYSVGRTLFQSQQTWVQHNWLVRSRITHLGWVSYLKVQTFGWISQPYWYIFIQIYRLQFWNGTLVICSIFNERSVLGIVLISFIVFI